MTEKTSNAAEVKSAQRSIKEKTASPVKYQNIPSNKNSGFPLPDWQRCLVKDLLFWNNGLCINCALLRVGTWYCYNIKNAIINITETAIYRKTTRSQTWIHSVLLTTATSYRCQWFLKKKICKQCHNIDKSFQYLIKSHVTRSP